MRKLSKSEINRIIKENSALSNDELLKKYFDILFSDVLGSQAELMEEAGWEESDVRERREYEDYMSCYVHILERMLRERGVNPWKSSMNNTTEGNNNAEIH